MQARALCDARLLLIGITIFDTSVLEQDFEKISQGLIDKEEDYRRIFKQRG